MVKEKLKVEFFKSTRKDKKLMAVFSIEKEIIKTIHFGAVNYEDFTIHKDPERKQRYIDRHKAREDWTVPMNAGSLALHILWGKPTLKASIDAYKKKFKLL